MDSEKVKFVYKNVNFLQDNSKVICLYKTEITFVSLPQKLFLKIQKPMEFNLIRIKNKIIEIA